MFPKEIEDQFLVGVAIFLAGSAVVGFIIYNVMG